MYYWAREFSSKLQEGKHYIELPRTIIMSIVNFKMFNCAEYYSRFRVLEAIRHTELTDKFEIIICELPKLPSELDIDNKLELWMRLFAAENEEDLQEIEAMEVPEMTQAIQTYRKITVSPEFQALERMREDAKNNEAAALHNAEQRGIQIGEQRGLTLAAINAIHAGITNPMAIAAIAGLSEDQAVALIQEYKRTP
jgi:predicted transposase/invertase (TIGR01784 family)